MAKQVRETPAGQSISAWVIMRGKRHVATVQMHYGNSLVRADCWQGDELARTRTAAALKVARDKLSEPQQGHAGGYGYDKKAAALSGLVIDGIPLSDHCGVSIKPPKGRRTFPAGFKAPKGFRFANWQGAQDDRVMAALEALEAAQAAATDTADYQPGGAIYQAKCDLIAAQREGDTAGYTSCYRNHGFGYLEAVGYTVIQAI